MRRATTERLKAAQGIEHLGTRAEPNYGGNTIKRFINLNTNRLALALCLAGTAFASPTASIPVGTGPRFVAVNQTTNVIYVSNLISNNVSVIDGATNTVVATVPVGADPEGLDVNPTTNMVYVANSQGASVSVIDGSTNTVTATVTGLSVPYGVAVNSVTNQVFVSNSNISTVSVIDGATNTITATVTVGSSPGGVRVNATANLAYVVSGGPGTVSVIDGQSGTVASTFNLPKGAEPELLAFDPITNRLFITNGVPAVVYVLDATAGTLLATVTGGKVPFKRVGDVTMFQPGKSVLISDGSLNAMIEVSESTYSATAGIAGGSAPYGIAVNRKTGRVYVAEFDGGTVNVYTQPK